MLGSLRKWTHDIILPKMNIFQTTTITIRSCLFPFVLILMDFISADWAQSMKRAVGRIHKAFRSCFAFLGRLGLFLLLMCTLILCKNNQIPYELMVIFVCLHFTLPQYRHYVGVSEDIELLKCFLPGTLECMSKIKSILSIIVHALYGAVCIQLTHVSCDVCEIMCT